MCLLSTLRSVCGHTVDTLVGCDTPRCCTHKEASLYYTELRCLDCWEQYWTPRSDGTTTTAADVAAELAGIAWVQATIQLDARAQWSRRRGLHRREQAYLARVEAARDERAAELTEGDTEPWVCWWEEGYRVWETVGEDVVVLCGGGGGDEGMGWDEGEGGDWLSEEGEEESVSSGSEGGAEESGEEELDGRVEVGFEEMMAECLGETEEWVEESREERCMERTSEVLEGCSEDCPETTFFEEGLMEVLVARHFERMREERLRGPF
ncbi:uncharacterized protein B0H64DRAFT_439558 [Chaetomium fimeti]|uniref:Uncharacterized protein n=1 Tax=Chaetomium fimeti TaxID=1854472 RepID=A0AAE0HMH2_9PEZI|nr:hypothetical protein B0H64DRAFT_439558 [Chaetomium fimeti]